MAKKTTTSKAATATATGPIPVLRMKQQYLGPVAEQVKQKFGVPNRLAMPRLDKIVLTVGMGKQLEGTKLNPQARAQVVSDLATITGQQPVVKKAKKSVANFKLREGFEIGAMVTLRGPRMWEFFDRLVSLAIPRIKDFRGLPTKNFDGRGNYSFGLGEQAVFPEIDMTKSQFSHGMNVTFVFRNSSDEKTRQVLEGLGVPFAKPEERQR